MTRLRTISAALALVAGAAAPAHAGGFLTARFGAEQGHVTTSHPSAAYYNPAGLAMRGGTRIALEGAFGWRTASYNRPPAAINNLLASGEQGSGTPSDAVSANSGKANLSNIVAAPFFGIASDLGVRNLGVGLSLSVPFGGAATWDQNSAYEGSTAYPGAVDGVQRWTVVEGSVRAIYGTLGAAYFIPGAKLSLGAGFNLVSQEVTVLRARNAASTDDLVASDGTLLEGRSLIDVKGNSFSAGGGLIWMPVQALQLGLSYQSQPLFGKRTLEGELSNKLGASDSSVSPIDFVQTLPDVWRFGASWRAKPKLELRAQVELQRWSVFDNQCVLDSRVTTRRCEVNADGSAPGDAGVLINLKRDWTDSYGLRLGGTYFLSPAVEFLGGLSYDTSAVPDETLDASFIDMPKVVAIAGGRFGLGGGFSLAAHWTQVFYAERTTKQGTPAETPSAVPSTAGTYNQSIGLLTVSAEYEF